MDCDMKNRKNVDPDLIMLAKGQFECGVKNEYKSEEVEGKTREKMKQGKLVNDFVRILTYCSLQRIND